MWQQSPEYGMLWGEKGVQLPGLAELYQMTLLQLGPEVRDP